MGSSVRVGEVSDYQEMYAALKGQLAEVLVKDRLAVDRVVRHQRSGASETARKQLAGWKDRLGKSHQKWLERKARCPIPTYPEDLPITARKEEIIAALRESQVVVIAGETGSGKTTQLPKMCLEAGLGIAGKIACTQPRRVAALSVSQRIAEELKVPWGREVGAKIRFTDRSSDDTYIKMMTDGMLLAEVQGDAELSEYDAVIVDEAHERSLNIDFLLGYLHRLRARRPDLKIIITSATIDTRAFSDAFGGAPIIEVSGRTYPVEVLYAPIDELLEESGELSVVDGVAKAVEHIVGDNQPGDILVFLPGEKDIRETRDLLEGQRLGRAEVLPLFGRLSNAEQQRIFAPTQARKIILATNIAETSLTIPGIRFVVDAGLARISRYNAQTHTRRLPIEPISQSSADQRKGRAGRVSDGICIRLYAEQDFLARPKYSTPEILRANLAEVILRMIAFRLGKIEAFPFLNPPSAAAIRAGYALLQDLGALDAERSITPLGRELARLPCDPTVGRMLLQARKEGAVREVLVIAAALSIQDPRERPTDAQEAADRMHRIFEHPESDFLSLLKIWDAYHDETEQLTQKQLRKFCKSHFVSYLRMREWREVHQQLSRVLDELGEVRANQKPAEYFQIHRSLLAGLLANVAQRDQGNHYLATHQRKVLLFPGSGLFDKQASKAERKSFKGQQKPAKLSGKRTPAWILCAEWMETSRLFARTAARIDIEWVLDLGEHLLRASYSEPYYEEKSERVLAKERLTLYGLEVAVNRVGYARINPAEATEIFLRAGLVAGVLRSQPPWYQANQQLRAEVEDKQTRLRHASAWQLDERVYQFYARRLEGSGVGSVGDVNRWLRETHGGRDTILRMGERDLLGTETLDVAAFPESLEVGSRTLPLAYHYRPGEDDDGATLRVPVSVLSEMDPEKLDWAVPGYLRERIDHLLRALPKATRVQLHPLADKLEELMNVVRPDAGPLQEQLSSWILKRFGLRVRPDDWSGTAVPAYLRPRIEVVDEEEKVISAGRDWEVVRAAFEAATRGRGDLGDSRHRDRNAVWVKARQRLERVGLTSWSFSDFAREQSIGEVAGVPVIAFPGLEQTEERRVNLRLFPSPEQAEAKTPAGFRQLLENAVAKDLGWLEKELSRELKRAKFPTTGWIPFPALERHAWAHACLGILAVDECLPLSKARFDTAVATARERMRGYAPRIVDQLIAITEKRRALRQIEDVNAARAETFERLLGPDFLLRTPPDRLNEVPRYLEALEKRLIRARLDPRKDLDKQQRVLSYVKQLAELKKPTPERAALFWALEEYRVQIFAQEMGTRAKVSPKLLDGYLASARQRELLPGQGATVPTPDAVVQTMAAGVAKPAPSRSGTGTKPLKESRKLEREDLMDLKASLEKGLRG